MPNNSQPLKVEDLVRPLSNTGPYLRPFVGDVINNTYNIFLIGLNPATPIFPSEIENVRFLQLIQNEKAFYCEYKLIRKKHGKAEISRTRKAIEQVVEELKVLTGENVLVTNVIPYPTASVKELEKISKNLLQASRARFAEVLLHHRPKIIILHGKKTYDQFMEIVEDFGFSVQGTAKKCASMAELENQIPSFSFKYREEEPTATVFCIRHLSYYGQKSEYFNNFFKVFKTLLEGEDRDFSHTNSSLELDKKQLPVLNCRTVSAIFDCVYGINSGHERTTQQLLKDDRFHYFMKMLSTIQEFNYRFRSEQVNDLFPVFEQSVGPMERNSEGTTLWLALGLAIKETYGMSNGTLEGLLKLISTHK